MNALTCITNPGFSGRHFASDPPIRYRRYADKMPKLISLYIQNNMRPSPCYHLVAGGTPLASKTECIGTNCPYCKGEQS